MRFKYGLDSLVLLVTSIYVLHLGATDALNLYIHPRYIVFTLAMSLIALLIVGVHTLYAKSNHAAHKESVLLLAPLVLVIAVAVALPARSLTSSTVTQRSIDAGSIVSTSNSVPLNTLFAGSSRSLKLVDWNRLLSTNTDADYYQNKPAKVSGFIYDAGLGDDTVWLARFVVTCCAVDAQPIGVPVQIEQWSDQYAQDEWIEVEGSFTMQATQKGEALVLVPESVTAIEEPSNPYAN